MLIYFFSKIRNVDISTFNVGPSTNIKFIVLSAHYVATVASDCSGVVMFLNEEKCAHFSIYIHLVKSFCF